MIAYKVTTRNRESFFIRELKYQLKYKEGTIVTAPENTIGIFCFTKKEDAIAMANTRQCIKPKILTVKGTKGKRLKFRPVEYTYTYLKYLKEFFPSIIRKQTKTIKETSEALCYQWGTEIKENSFTLSNSSKITLRLANKKDSTIVFDSVIVLD